MVENYFVRLRIGKENLISNFNYFKSKLRPETKMLILVKANSYGHGAVEFLNAVGQENIDYLGVAHPTEGIELRIKGIKTPILVLTTGYDNFNDIIKYNLEPSIPTIYTLKELNNTLIKKGLKDYPVHIKIDTGMHRLGFVEKEIPELLAFLASKECRIKVEGVFSHLAVAEDASQDNFTHLQLKKYEKITDAIEKTVGYKFIKHILNTSGTERFPEYQFDMVRIGIGIYGINAVNSENLELAAALECKIIQIKELDTTDTVGYDRYGKINRPSRIATIPLGYADGIDRCFGMGRASFEVNGKLAPTVGTICMDMCMIDITNIDAKVGDIVTIFGKNPTAVSLAKIRNTIPYEIFTSVSNRVPRVLDERI